MFDYFTYFIYIGLLVTLVFLTSVKQKFTTAKLDFGVLPKLRLQHFVALLILSFVVGFRYQVGNDWEGYKNDFLETQSYPYLTYGEQYYEYGFYLITKGVIKVGLSYEWMFFTSALISWYFIFKSLPKLLLPILIYFLFVDQYLFWSMNGVRQFTAMSIWLVAIRFINNKNFIKYFIVIFFASLFHRSVLLLLPLYFIPYFRINKKKLWIGLFLYSLIIGSSNEFINFIELIINYIGQKFVIIELYIRYVESGRFVSEDTNLGLGFVFIILVNLFIILISGGVIKKYPQTLVYFILFFIGAILFNLSYNIQLLGRINNYFLIIRSIVLAISVYHFWKISKYRIFVVGFCFLYFLLFIFAIYNSSNMCTPYNFIF